MALKNQVIYIDDKPSKKEKPVEFTHVETVNGWAKTKSKSSDYTKIVYLGKCNTDGDMFAAYDINNIIIFKGHLNSGKY